MYIKKIVENKRGENMLYGIENEQSKESLVRALGIFELRGLARELGVKSPTTKKREELVERILEIIQNGEGQKSLDKRKGRPFKKLSSIQQIASSVTSSWDEEKSDRPSYTSVMCFAQTIPDFERILEGSKTLRGYARDIENAICFYDYSNDKRVFIKKDVEFASKISSGDYIEVQASPSSEYGKYVAEKIISINDVDAKCYEPYNADNGEIVIGRERMDVAGRSVILGRRNCLCLKEDIYDTNILDELINCCASRKTKLLVIALNTSYENMIMFKNANCKKFVSPSGTDAKLNLDLLVDGINYASGCIERGENVLLLVCDIMHTLKAVEGCFGGDEVNGKENMEILTQKLIGIAKAYESKTSATSVFTYYNLDMKNEHFVDKIFKVCKNCE